MVHSKKTRAESRKRTLTEVEKAEIWHYYQENPLVTHTDVASFFGVERSTVSKIVHSPQYDTAPYVRRPPPSVSGLPAHAALEKWVRDREKNQERVTRAMLRKKAAILAATTWMERKAAMRGIAAFPSAACWFVENKAAVSWTEFEQYTPPPSPETLNTPSVETSSTSRSSTSQSPIVQESIHVVGHQSVPLPTIDGQDPVLVLSPQPLSVLPQIPGTALSQEEFIGFEEDLGMERAQSERLDVFNSLYAHSVPCRDGWRF